MSTVMENLGLRYAFTTSKWRRFSPHDPAGGEGVSALADLKRRLFFFFFGVLEFAFISPFKSSRPSGGLISMRSPSKSITGTISLTKGMRHWAPEFCATLKSACSPAHNTACFELDSSTQLRIFEGYCSAMHVIVIDTRKDCRSYCCSGQIIYSLLVNYLPWHVPVMMGVTVCVKQFSFLSKF